MIIRLSSRSGLTLIELSVTTVVAGIIGLAAYALLNLNFVLAAKNTAINTTHQQARAAMLNMLKDFHSAVSIPQLADSTGKPSTSPPPSGKAAGIAFQKWASGPYAIKSDVLTTDNIIHVALLSSQPIPIYYPPGSNGVVTQKLIVPTHQIESFITGISGSKSDLSIMLNSDVPVEVKGTASTGGHVICFITDVCSYTVSKPPSGPDQDKNVLNFNYRGGRYPKTSGTDLTNATPFYVLPDTAVGAAFSFTVNDSSYSNRKYQSLQILLNGEAPIKAQLTTYQ